MVCQINNAIVMVAIILTNTISSTSGGSSRIISRHWELDIGHDVFFDVVHSVQVRVQGVLTSVLLATLGTDDVSVLAAKMNIFDVSFKTHLMKILVTIGTTFSGRRFFISTTRSSGYGSTTLTQGWTIVGILRRGWGGG